MRKLFVYFIFLMIIMTSQILAGTIYYVDATNGDDRNSGTSSSHAWKTISKVNSFSFNAGDSIYFKKGEEWRETLVPLSSGSSGNPITFGAYGTKADPIINGADLVTEWSEYDTNIWQATVTIEPNQIFFDGTRGNKQTSLDDVDSDKDWYWTSNVLYVYSTSDPDTTYINPGIEASSRNYSLYPDAGVNYIIIQNINFNKSNHSNIYLWYAHQNWILDGITSNYAYQEGIWIEGDGSTESDIIIQNSDFSYNGKTGISLTLDCQDITIRNNDVHHNSQLDNFNDHAGIRVYGGPYSPPLSPQYISGVLIESNHIYSNGYSGQSGQRGKGIWIDMVIGTDTIIRYNRVNGNYHNGIESEYTDGTQIYYNLSYDNSQAGLYLYREIDNIKLYNNISYNNKFGIGIDGISDGGSTTITNNLIKNNICSENSQYELIADNGGDNDGTEGFGNVYEYNCFGAEASHFISWGGSNKSTYDAWETAYGSTTHFVESDPQMTDPSNDDFTLQYGSPCIDAGTNVGLTQDYAGNGVPYGCCVDIGAFEFIGESNPLNAEINASATSGVTPLTVNFTGNATGGSSPYSYSWDFGDGESSSEQNPSHIYSAEGNYTVNLTVIDSNNSQASDSVIITTIAPADPLSVSVSASPASGVVPLTVSFSASVNGGSSPYSYSWDFGDDASSSEQNPSHTYNQVGTYNVILIVTDSEDSQVNDSLTIEASSNPTFTLNISSVTGSPAPGSGGTTDPDPGSYSYSHGTSVKVTAIPNSDYRFSKWSGDVSSSNVYDEEISISMDKDKSISAYFFTKCGDVNGDLSLTAADAQWAFDIYLGRIADPTESEKENADVTCDGTTASPNVTPADAHAIFEKFIGRNELPCDCSCKSRTASYQAQTSEVRDITVFVDSILFNESNEIVVPVAIDKSFGIHHSFGFDFLFPSDVLEFVAVEESEEIKDYFMVDANEIADGVIRAGGFRKSFNLIHNPRTLIKLIFRVIEEVKGTISFNITNTVDDIKNASFRSRRIEEKKISYRR